jgi:biotin operon repressor
MENDPELLAFLKALADTNRLKMIGLLAHRPYSGEELSAMLGLKASTISHHLARLSAVGLVSARAEGYYNMYRLDQAALQKIRRLFSHTDLVTAAAGVDVAGYDRKVVADFSRPDGSLKEIPAQRKKLEAILRHVVRDFEPGRRYSEKQVNQTLSRYHEDTASLRRELVGIKLMQRAGGEYWRLESGEKQEMPAEADLV